MHAAVTRVLLRVHGARSLKDKRQRLRPVIDRLRHRYHLSVSETDHQDTWNLAELGIAVVAPDSSRVVELLERAEQVVHTADDLEVLELDRTWVELD